MRCSSFLSVLLSVFLFSINALSEVAIDSLRASTVHIAVGSGFIIEGPEGGHYLMTNAHVCNAGRWHNKMRANYQDGTLIEGLIIKSDLIVDLCISKVSRSHPGIKIAKSLSPRQQIYTRGYPFGILSETSGQYTGKDSWDYMWPIEEVGECFKGSKPVRSGTGNIVACSVRYTDNITNMYSRPGSSGSPVVDVNGELVGVMSSWLGDRDAGGMVPLELIQEFMKGY